MAEDIHRLRGRIFGYTWLDYLDAYSKYRGAISLTTTTASYTSSALRKVLFLNRIAEAACVGNGRPSDIFKFAVFSESNGILHCKKAS